MELALLYMALCLVYALVGLMFAASRHNDLTLATEGDIWISSVVGAFWPVVAVVTAFRRIVIGLKLEKRR